MEIPVTASKVEGESSSCVAFYSPQSCKNIGWPRPLCLMEAPQKAAPVEVCRSVLTRNCDVVEMTSLVFGSASSV